MKISPGLSAKKSVYAALVLCAVLMMPLSQVPIAGAVEFNAKEKTLQFLSNVATLDLTEYNVTLRSDKVEYLDNFGGAPQESVRYILQTNDSYLDATCVYLDGIYDYCLLSWREGLPIYVQQQPTNLVDVAKEVLERYQAFSGSSRYQPLRVMLDSVSKAENTVVTSGNYELEVTVNGRMMYFDWKYNINGAEWSVLGFSLQMVHCICLAMTYAFSLLAMPK